MSDNEPRSKYGWSRGIYVFLNNLGTAIIIVAIALACTQCSRCMSGNYDTPLEQLSKSTHPKGE